MSTHVRSSLYRIKLGKFGHKFYCNNMSVCLGIKTSEKLDIWALMAKNMSSKFANNSGADQPANLCSLISTFVICLLESIIYKLATSVV